jgi:hypothetical protein
MSEHTVRLWEAVDSTGYRSVFADVTLDATDPDRCHAFRIRMQQTGQRTWSVSGIAGPYEERDRTGSYYTYISHPTPFEGTLSQAKTMAKRLMREAIRVEAWTPRHGPKVEL